MNSKDFPKSSHQKARTFSELGKELETFRAHLKIKRQETQQISLKDEANITKLRSEVLIAQNFPKKPDLDQQIPAFVQSSTGNSSLNHLSAKEYHPSLYSDSNGLLQSSKNPFRGEFPEPDDHFETVYSRIIAKLQQYKERILSNTNLERELSLFIEVLACPSLTRYCDQKRKKRDITGVNMRDGDKVAKSEKNMNECVELTFDIRKSFLNDDSAKILLLIGEAGSGKSLFCKHLQREILSVWRETHPPDPGDENWFPIYVELSSLKNQKSNVFSETLSKELSLTEEEILLLQTCEKNNALLPCLLFIFDGYDEIEQFYYLIHSLNSDQDFKDNNFCALYNINEATWKNAKFIITCREESLQHMEQRDPIFAPMRFDSNELSVVPGSFIQTKIEPFTDEQITCYLKKSCVLRQAGIFGVKDSKSPSLSWSLVKNVERMIDEYGLRDIARNPFMLKVIIDALPEIFEENHRKDMNLNLNQPSSQNSLSIRLLIDCFINKVIKSVYIGKNLPNEEGERRLQALFVKNTKLKFQNLALRLSNYSQKSIAVADLPTDDSDFTKFHSLIDWDSSLSKSKFSCKLLQDYFVAKSIEEQLLKTKVLLFKINTKVPIDLLINQRPLNNQIILFLRDSVRDQRLKSDRLMDLIMLSRANPPKSPFGVAASNAITVLNSSGYDFSGKDLSNVCIPDANLRYGIFEGTNFRNSNLQGADFTGAWLKDSNCVSTNLKNIVFGEILDFKLSNEKIEHIAYSGNGMYLALSVDEETVILKKNWAVKPYFSVFRRFSGCILPYGNSSFRISYGSISSYESNPFSRNSQKMMTFIVRDGFKDEENQKTSFCVWDIVTGELLEKFDVSMGGKELVHFNLDQMQILAFKEGKLPKIYMILLPRHGSIFMLSSGLA